MTVRQPNDFSVPVKRGGVAFVLALGAAAAFWFIHLWLFSEEAWLHKELFRSSAFIWNKPGPETFLGDLKKVLNWHDFDKSVNRVRPINDVFEVVDAIARPYLTRLFGPEPALYPSTILTVLLVPAFLLGWLRRALGNWLPALFLVLVFISTTGFLSCTVASIHPAKRLDLIFLAGALFFAQRHAEKGDSMNFAWLCACLLGSFFSDEMGLANFPIVAALYWRSLATNIRPFLAFLSLPILFLVLTKWALPAVYLRVGDNGKWDALADPKKFALYGYLISPHFYRVAGIELARSLLSIVGCETHTRLTEIVALCVLSGATLLHVWRSCIRSVSRLATDPLVMATLALVAASIFATLLDWYPWPYEVNYLGAFNYYYHSPIALLAIIWFGLAWKSLAPRDRPSNPMWVATTAVSLGTLVILLNFALFHRVNCLAEIIHTYPFSNRELFEALAKTRGLPNGSSVSVVVVSDPKGQEDQFMREITGVFGPRWQDNGFYTTFQRIKRWPMIRQTQVDQLFYIYYPFLKVSATIQTSGSQD